MYGVGDASFVLLTIIRPVIRFRFIGFRVVHLSDHTMYNKLCTYFAMVFLHMFRSWFLKNINSIIDMQILPPCCCLYVRRYVYIYLKLYHEVTYKTLHQTNTSWKKYTHKFPYKTMHE